MAIPFLSNINLNGNQALNLALHNKTTPPSNPSSGQIYFDTADTDNGRVLVYNGSAWVSIAGDIESIATTTSNQLTVTNGTGPDVSLAIQTGAVANGGTALATGDQIYDFVTGLGYVESVTSGNTDTITIGGTAADPTISANTAAVANGSASLATGDQIYDFVIGQNYSTTTGTVTSVAIAGTDGIDVDSGSPITSSGTITLGLSNVPNTSLANSSITIGDSTIALGGTDTTLTGLTDIDLTEASHTIFDNVGANTLTIGAGTTTVVIPGDLTVTGTVTTNNVETVSTSNGVIFEGNAADANELILLAGTLTADQTITLPDATGTVALTSDIHNGTLTVQGSNGLTGSGTFTANDSSSPTITISHADTSSQASVNNSGRTYIQDITLDTYGHITGITSATETVTNTDTQLATAAALIDVSAMGSNTTASFIHGLTSKNLIVQLYDVTTGEVVFADVDHTSNNAISVIFASTPANDIRVVVIDAKDGLTDKTVTYS